MNVKRLVTSFLSGAVLSAFAAMPAMAQESDPSKEQFIPVLTYKTGPFAAGGSGVAGGMEDYLLFPVQGFVKYWPMARNFLLSFLVLKLQRFCPNITRLCNIML